MSRLKEIGIESHGLDRGLAYQFRLQTRHVSALVERLLPKVQTPNYWKVLIICCEKKPERDRNLAVIGGVMDVYIPCDIASYFKLNDQQKKEFAFQAIAKGLELASEHTGIGGEEFKQALEASRSLVNEWSWPKSPCSSPDRKWKAQLWCSHELEKFTAHLMVLDKQKNEVARVFVFEAQPSEFQFVPRMHAPEWLSATEIAVGDQIWLWDAVTLKLKPKKP